MLIYRVFLLTSLNFLYYDNLIRTPKLQDDLDSSVISANEWSLEHYLNKCKVMHFGKKIVDADLNRGILT